MGIYPAETTKLLDYPEALANILRRAALAAGDAIMEHYDPSGYTGEVGQKEDLSPVTQADLAADLVIAQMLAHTCPGIPILSEETASTADIKTIGATPHYWLIDPLDGTRDFKKGSPEFTVNIALVQNHTPILGVVYAPALGEGFLGRQDGTALRWVDASQKDHLIKVRAAPREGLTVLTATSSKPANMKFVEDLVTHIKMERLIRRSSSIKFCDIAAGRADVYARLTPMHLWDTAAAEAVLRAAGGHIVDFTGQPIVYNPATPDFATPAFVAMADQSYILPVLQDMISSETFNPQNRSTR